MHLPSCPTYKGEGVIMQPAKGFHITARGASIPVVGYGTMEFPEPDKAAGLVAHSIRCGYRHVDGAQPCRAMGRRGHPG